MAIMASGMALPSPDATSSFRGGGMGQQMQMKKS